jgi:hypothetical protein
MGTNPAFSRPKGTTRHRRELPLSPPPPGDGLHIRCRPLAVFRVIIGGFETASIHHERE